MERRRWQALWIGPLLGGATALGASAEFSAAHSVIREWVQAKQAISRTRAAWIADQETIGQTIAMFENELAALQAESVGVSTNVAQIDRERAVALASQAEWQAGLDLTAQRLAELERRLEEAAPAFPPPLQSVVASLLDRLPDDPETTRLSPAQRLQTVVTLLNEVEKFNATVTLNSEMRRTPDGGETKVRVLYFGLAQAWFVDEPGVFAGTGAPSRAGWEWKAQPKLAADIQRAIAMYEEKQPAAFVALPVEIR